MKLNMKNIYPLLLVLMSFFLSATVQAESSALDVVKNTSSQVIERLKDDSQGIKSDPKRINQLVDELITPSFDFPKMSRWVLGKNWRKASDDQKVRFSNAFQSLLIRTYSRALAQSDNVDIKYLPEHPSKDGKKTTIKTEVYRPGGAPLIPISYRLYKAGDTWKVYDVSIDGVSLVSTYRGSFNDKIKKKGLDALISSLESRS